MRLILIFLPYVIIPLIICWLYKRLKLKGLIILTHLIVAICTLFLPTLLFLIGNWLDPPREEQMCGTPEVMLNIANIVIMIPVTQLLTYLFNQVFKNSYFPSKKNS